MAGKEQNSPPEQEAAGSSPAGRTITSTIAGVSAQPLAGAAAGDASITVSCLTRELGFLILQF